jgi:hypothetical protein
MDLRNHETGIPEHDAPPGELVSRQALRPLRLAGEISTSLVLATALVAGISSCNAAVLQETQLVNGTAKRAARNQCPLFGYNGSAV